MGKFVNSVEEFFKYCADNEVDLRFRFTDMKGTCITLHILWKQLVLNLSQMVSFILFSSI